MKLKNKFQRSKVFTEVIFSKTIPGKLLIEQEDGRIYIFNGKIDEKAQRMEKATRAVKSFSRLDNAKVALEEMENLRIKQLIDQRRLQNWFQMQKMSKAA